MDKIQLICIAAIPLIFAITIHEAAHGYIASKCGDQTASIMGRVSFNPLRHIDPFGTVILPLLMLMFGGFIFGWAKPVPVVYQNLRKPRRDMALVAMAGPAANVLMALFWGIAAKLSYIVFGNEGLHVVVRQMALFISLSAQFGIMINCVIFVINLIPIPPLDGSRLITSFLPSALAKKYNRLEYYGLWIFLGFIVFMMITNTTFLIQTPIVGMMHGIYDLMHLSAAN